jgi:hypothetical protein
MEGEAAENGLRRKTPDVGGRILFGTVQSCVGVEPARSSDRDKPFGTGAEGQGHNSTRQWATAPAHSEPSPHALSLSRTTRFLVEDVSADPTANATFDSKSVKRKMKD